MDLLPPQGCPRWCANDVGTDIGVLHLSATVAAAGFTVSVERLDQGDGRPAAIRVEGSGDGLSPQQAFELASVLQAAAVAALLGGRSPA